MAQIILLMMLKIYIQKNLNKQELNITINKQEMIEKQIITLIKYVLLKMILLDENYRKNLDIPILILMIVARITELKKEEQNQIALYLIRYIT